MVWTMTLTLTLEGREALSANQRAISPHTRDLWNLRDLYVGQI